MYKFVLIWYVCGVRRRKVGFISYFDKANTLAAIELEVKWKKI